VEHLPSHCGVEVARPERVRKMKQREM
jgi:hypothetical protein